jgi:hypothetical protein
VHCNSLLSASTLEVLQHPDGHATEAAIHELISRRIAGLAYCNATDENRA